jgi:hypothetical protein
VKRLVDSKRHSFDKIHSKQIELTYYQWSGKHHSVVKGIGLITLVWTDGTSTFPIDYRIYDKDGNELSKNDHFQDMVKTASGRGFQPSFVMFNEYTGIDNLKCVSQLGWNWFSRIKKNRMVNSDHTNNRQVSSLTIPDDGLKVYMKKFGFVRVFHTVNKEGKERYWATNFLTKDHEDRRNLQNICESIENYPCALKELCCVDNCKIRKEVGQWNLINCSIRAFIRLEVVNRINNITIYNAKWEIVKSAIAGYLAQPKYAL